MGAAVTSWLKWCVLVCLGCMIAACGARSHYAPVTDVNQGGEWLWPAKGKVVASFSSQNRGIDIVGQLGESVYASAAGRVVYCGNGLRGYGNLIIIKHYDQYMSTYARNQILFVSEGQRVRKGQKIAEMGFLSPNKSILHFEIRRNGQPVNPMTLLGV